MAGRPTERSADSSSSISMRPSARRDSKWNRTVFPCTRTSRASSLTVFAVAAPRNASRICWRRPTGRSMSTVYPITRWNIFESGSASVEFDLRSIPPPGGHVQVYRAFRDLGVGELLTLVADRDLAEIRAQFERDFPRGFSWRDLESAPAPWRGGLVKPPKPARPRTGGNTGTLPAPRMAGTQGRGK